MADGGWGRKASEFRAIKNEGAEIPSGKTQVPLMLFRWKVILGVLLVGSVVLKLVVMAILFSAIQYTSTETQPESLTNNVNESCEVIKDSSFADVAFHPDTAHPKLSICCDLRTVKWTDLPARASKSPRRFDSTPYVLGCQGFTSGRHWWEVQVGKRQTWALGTARKSLNWKGPLVHSMWRYWMILSDPNSNKAFEFISPNKISNTQKIFLDYTEGQILFYNAVEGNQIYKLKATVFDDKIYPSFCLGPKAQLRLPHCNLSMLDPSSS